MPKPLALLTSLVLGISVVQAQSVTRETVPGVTNFARVETTIACAGATTPAALVGLKKMGYASVINLRMATEAGADIEGEAAAAKAAGVNEVAVFLSASEGFSRANLNCSIAESIERARPVAEAAKADGILLRGYVSCVVQCPYDGPVEPCAVARVTGQLLRLGCHEVSLGDTIGRARPAEVAAMLDVVLAVAFPENLAGHFHDTNGLALDNIRVALDHGLTVFDASVGGLGGCPYAPGARGNVDTLAVADMLAAEGYETGLDREKLAAAAAFARRITGKADIRKSA